MATTRPVIALWLRIKNFLLEVLLRVIGIVIDGQGLHSNGKVRVRVIPRGPGHGINLIRLDAPGNTVEAKTIPITLGFVGRNIRRLTGIENRGLRVGMVEHILFALRVLNIWNADIVVDAEEMPVLDGSARVYLDMLKPLENWSEPPQELRISEPVVFRRDNNTAVIILPLREDETDSEYIFVGNYALQVQPTEFKIILKDSNLGEAQAEMGSLPTFLERDVEELREQRKFLGGVEYASGEHLDATRAKPVPRGNFISVKDPELWKDPVLVRGLARHKTMDVIGDLMILELSLNRRLKARVIALGTGHRDTAEAMFMVESGYRFPVGYHQLVEGNLATMLSENKISREQHYEILRHLEPYRDYDTRLLSEGSATTAMLSDIEVERLRRNTVWTDKRAGWRDLAMKAANDYLYLSQGAGLVLIADQLATQQFRADQIERIEVQLSEETEREIVCEVTFVRTGMSKFDWPRVSLVVAKKPDDEAEALSVLEAVSQGYFQMKKAADKNEARRPAMVEGRAADRSVDYFPRVGPLRYGAFARQWLSRNFARFSPSVSGEEAVRSDADMPFGLFWDNDRTSRDVNTPSVDERRRIARATAELLTAAFVRLRLARSGTAETVPNSGLMLHDIDLTSDILYDPADGRGALGFIRSARSASAEQFLYQLFQLRSRVEFGRMSTEDRPRFRKEWQPFAEDLSYILRGVEAALIAEFGPEKGRRGAIDWYKRYLAAVDDPGHSALSDHVGKVRETWKYRHVEATSVPETFNLLESEIGQPILPLLDERIQALEAELLARTAASTARWLAESLAWLTGFPSRVWLRLAPFTEALVFPAIGIMAVSFSSLGVSGAASAGLSGLIAMAVWMMSHREVLTKTGSDLEWTPFGELPARLKMRVGLMGLLVAAIPAALFFYDFSMAVAVAGLAAMIHAAANPDTSAESTSGPVLDRRQRVRRQLESEV